jgi:phosphoesterase RecJ-like protein
MSEGVSGAGLPSDDALDRAVEAIASARHLALACHVTPDGDALGSMLGMFHALRGAGRDAVASFAAPFVIAPHYRLLPGLDLLTKPDDFPAAPDVMITFDAGSMSRLGDLAASAQRARELIVVDHHISNDRFGTINVIRPDAAASGVVTVELLDRLGVPLTRDAAVCLYAALVCDTGRFQYETTTPATFELAGRLTTFDVPVGDLSRSLFEEHRFAYLQLMAEAVAHATLVRDKRLVWTAVTREMLMRHEVTIEEAEGLIDVLRRTSEAEVTCVLKEEPDGRIKVSLRSLGAVDVRLLAQAHGGGGHRFAAGFTSDLGIEVLVERISAAL